MGRARPGVRTVGRAGARPDRRGAAHGRASRTGAPLSTTAWSEELAGLGPFFEVATAPGPDWLALRELVGAAVLGERVRHTRAALASMASAEVEDRVAASTMSLGLFARLVSPVLAAATLGTDLPRVRWDTAHWRPVAGGPWPLALTGEPEPADLDGLLAEVLDPLAGVIGAAYALSGQVLRGNITSAVFGAATMLGRARPELAVRANERATALLAGPLEGTGTMEKRFVRSSCCLYYRIPGGGYCGDCVLAR